MSDRSSAAVAAQREYYERTAASYDDMQVSPSDEHAVALAWMAALIEQRGYQNVLDVGCGTGRALFYLKERLGERRTTLIARGIEPSPALREIGHQKGLGADELIAGDALALPYANDSFDIVCSFGVLHHISDHARAVDEMTRVAKHAVFISDANNFGQGSLRVRVLKQALKAAGLWKLFDYVRTGFRGHHYSEGDGVFYSYSIHRDVPIVRAKFPDVLYMSTQPSGPNLYRSAQSIAIFATRVP